MNIDFIKWMVRYAEGYHLKTIHGLDAIDYGEEVESLEDFSSCESIARSHLLTRVIEGINNSENYDIIQTRSNIVIYGYYKNPEPVYFELEPKLPDQAKEAALKYIYEQEKSNG